MQNTPEREIDLMRLLYAMWQKLWIIALAALLTGLLSFGITKFFVTPMYQANVSIYVDNTTKAENENQSISSSSLSTAQKLVRTYVTFIKSDTVLENVIAVGGFDLTAKQIRGMLSAGSVDDTEVFRVYISSPDPQLAADVANVIADVAPAQISGFIGGSSTKILDRAKVPSAPYTPSYQRNIALGAIVGAVLAAAIICLAAVIDVRIKDEEELERMFDRPVLGSIPSFDINERAKGKYAKYSKYGYSRNKYGYGYKPARDYKGEDDTKEGEEA